MIDPTSFRNSQYPLTCAFIAGAGIAPEDIIVDGITVGGYYEYFLFEGRKIMLRDEFARFESRWPSLEFGVAVRMSMLNEDLWREGEADRRILEEAR